MLSFASAASALQATTRRTLFEALPKIGAGVAATTVVGLPAFAADEPAVAETFTKKLKPLYKAALEAKLTRRMAPGEVAMPMAFEQGDDSDFIGRYTDPNHPGGIRDITILSSQIGIFRLAKVAGGGGAGEPASYELPALVYGDRITVDFSPKGGPAGLTGTFTTQKGTGIKWPDGNKWPKVDEKKGA